VPDRTPSDRADLVVFRDDERKQPYTVIECKQDGVTDAGFKNASENMFLGSTGDPPVPFGDPPDETGTALRASGDGFFATALSPVPVGGSPTGAGGSPAPPIFQAHPNQAVEQSCGNGTCAKFRANCIGVVAGMTRRGFDFSGKYGVLEREANLIADLPRLYGKPEEYRFNKGDPNNDLQPVSKAALISAIKKCHRTLWTGGKSGPFPITATSMKSSANSAVPCQQTLGENQTRQICAEQVKYQQANK
jgi:hypothetical protein